MSARRRHNSLARFPTAPALPSLPAPRPPRPFWMNTPIAARPLHFDVAPYSVSLSAITNSWSRKDKGLIVSAAEVQWGVCAGLRGGLPSSVFLSEIFEWDQTVIRSKRTQKRTHARTSALTHMELYLSRLQGGNGVVPVNGATPKEVRKNSPVL